MDKINELMKVQIQKESPLYYKQLYETPVSTTTTTVIPTPIEEKTTKGYDESLAPLYEKFNI